MKVSEAIEKLQMANPDSDVVVQIKGESFYVEEIKIENSASVVADAVIFIDK